MSFPTHAEYKDSGDRLLGLIPVGWDVWKLAHAFTDIGSGTTPKSDKPEYYEEGTIPWVNTGDLDDRPLADCAKKITVKAVEDHSTLKQYPAGSLLFAMYGATIGKLGLLEFPATVNQACCVFSGESPISIKFLFYWFLGLRKRILSLATGGGQPNVSQDILRTLRVACPDDAEQTAIAAFLDRETAKIDALIAEQQRLIELLQEKRQAVISHAVTKGLNPDVPMKNSGIEWLGEVPEHWEVKRLKHVSPNMTVGIVVNPSTYVANDGLPFIYGGDIREGFIDWENSRRISQAASDLQAKTKLACGDLLMVRVGAPGVTAVVPPECSGGNCASVMLIRQGDFSSHWLCFLLNTRVVRFQVEVVQYGAAQEQFNISHAVNFWVPVPPPKEQNDIAEATKAAVGQTDALVAEVHRAITLLQERRSALISAAVTGQIDVRGLAGSEAA